MRFICSIILIFSFSSLYAKNADVRQLAKELNLYAGSKAIIQWERVFSSQRHLVRYKLDTLSQAERDQLKEYLIQHAADSKQPIVPGL